jgi:HlyD family secretion protein
MVDTLTKGASPAQTRRRGKQVLRRWLGRAVIALLVAAAIAAVVFSLRPRPVPVEVTEVTRGSLEVVLEEDGKTRVRARFVVSAPLLGRVLRPTLRAGDPVEEGQVVATILPQAAPLLDPRTLAEAESRAHASSAGVKQATAGVERAKVARDLAQQELARAKALADSGAIGKSELDRAMGEARLRDSDLSAAQFGAQVARHEEAVARAVLKRSTPGDDSDKAASITVVSPVKGRVLHVYQESEGVVGPGQALLEIGDPDNLEIVVDVLSADAVRVRGGQRATVERWGGDPLAAHVRVVEPSARTKLSALGVEEQRVDVVLDLDDARDRWAALGDGYRVEVRVVLEDLTDVVRVPVGALFRDREGWAAFVIDAEGVARRRELELIVQSTREAAVKSGLAAGDRVVLHPSDRVKDGVKVELRAQER